MTYKPWLFLIMPLTNKVEINCEDWLMWRWLCIASMTVVIPVL